MTKFLNGWEDEEGQKKMKMIIRLALDENKILDESFIRQSNSQIY